jgi:hypothetical protein
LEYAGAFLPAPLPWRIEIMKKSLLFVFVSLVSGFLSAAVEYDASVPQSEFVAQELNAALKEAGKENVKVTLTIKPDASSPESFQIRSAGPTQVWIIGSDATGAMYGGLEVADLLRLGLPIDNQERAPFVGKRGIKFNIPWDVSSFFWHRPPMKSSKSNSKFSVAENFLLGIHIMA